MPQVNEDFAPRPEYKAFTNNPFIGVHQRSPINPNAGEGESQRKGITDWMQEIREHKWFPLAIAGIIVIVVISLITKKGAPSSWFRGGSYAVKSRVRGIN
jgi:hypothetical protein